MSLGEVGIEVIPGRREAGRVSRSIDGEEAEKGEALGERAGQKGRFRTVTLLGTLWYWGKLGSHNYEFLALND